MFEQSVCVGSFSCSNKFHCFCDASNVLSKSSPKAFSVSAKLSRYLSAVVLQRFYNLLQAIMQMRKIKQQWCRKYRLIHYNSLLYRSLLFDLIVRMLAQQTTTSDLILVKCVYTWSNKLLVKTLVIVSAAKTVSWLNTIAVATSNLFVAVQKPWS